MVRLKQILLLHKIKKTLEQEQNPIGHRGTQAKIICLIALEDESGDPGGQKSKNCGMAAEHETGYHFRLHYCSTESIWGTSEIILMKPTYSLLTLCEIYPLLLSRKTQAH